MFESSTLDRRVNMRTQWYRFKVTLCPAYILEKSGIFWSGANIVQIMAE